MTSPTSANTMPNYEPSTTTSTTDRSHTMTHPIDPAAREVRRLQEQLRATETELGQERRRSADLGRRLAAAEARVTALQVHQAQLRVAAVDACGEALYEKPIRDVPTGGLL